MTTINLSDNYFTLINTFEVEPADAERLIDILHGASPTMRKMPGFISANLHLASDRKRVVNYVQWRSREDFEAMHRHADAQPHMKAAAEVATSYNPVFYSLVHADTN